MASMTTSPASNVSAANIIAEDEGHNGSSLELITNEPLRFSVGHFMLFYHLENEILKAPGGILMADDHDTKPFAAMLFKSASSAPYLMDELLAFSALHLSTLQSDNDEKAQYLRQAAELQTRALSLFNAVEPQVHDENCVAMFVFSSVIGMHALFDGVRSRKDFTDFLDGIIRYLKLHRGVRPIARQSWNLLRETELKLVINPIEDSNENEPTAYEHGECDTLASLLEVSRDQLGPEPYRVCYEAVQTLIWAFGQHRVLPKPYPTHITLAWPIMISAEFVELLEQRQPISLVILAHWGVLLHKAREFWVFADAGRVLIEFMSGYLGIYWNEWMALPRKVLNGQ